MPTQPIKLASVIPLFRQDSEASYRDMLALAEALRRGEITSISYTATTPCGKTRQGMIGRAFGNIPLAILGAHRLLRDLLDRAN